MKGLINIVSLFLHVKLQIRGQSVCVKLEGVYESVCSNHTNKKYESLSIDDATRNRLYGEDDLEANENLTTNCNRTVSNVSRGIQEMLDKQRWKYSEMMNELLRAKERIRQLENREDYCPVRYNGKCFWIEVYYSGIVCEYARQLCKNKGAKMADIYSIAHYYMIMGHLRVFAIAGGWTHAWLGMRYNQKTDGVTLSNGTVAPFVKWFPGLPQREDAYCCCIAIRANLKWTDRDQHMFNANTEELSGVVCEKPLP